LEPEDCIQTVYKRGYRLTAEVWPQGVALAGAIPRLAIPPFKTEYGIPEHLGPAVAEETIVRLTNMQPACVKMLARDSVFTLAHRRFSALQIGETLKADLVLSGTLRALPSHFRLRAEMIRVADGAQVWVEDMLVEKGRMAGLEAELATHLSFRLRNRVSVDAHPLPAPTTHLIGSAMRLANGHPTGGLSLAAVAAPALENKAAASQKAAYEVFQQGHYEWQTLERHRMQDGMQNLYRATELDPSLVAAKVDLVNLCVTQAFYGFMAPAVAADIVRRTAHHDSGSQSSETHEALLPALAWINFHADRDLPAALWAFSRSAHLPHDPWTTRIRAMFSLSRHRYAEAFALLQAALDQDPFAPWLHARMAWAMHLNGQAEQSVRQINKALDLFPEHEGAALYGSIILAYNGDTARATELAQSLLKLSPHFDLAQAVLAYALARSGRAAEASAILERQQWLSRERFVLNAFHVAVYVALNDLDAAISELRNANEIRCPWFFQILADPRLKPLHGHPEFIQMQEILPAMEAAVETSEPVL
jgi:TolB-like protein/tetratricopeptide (TPR) repeat protein